MTPNAAQAGQDFIVSLIAQDDVSPPASDLRSYTIHATSATANQPPTADAGADQTVDSGAAVNLNGSGSSDPDGDPLTYSWTQTGGPAVSLSGANTATPSFTAPTGPATLSFQLEVCDDGTPSLCDTDTVAVEVNPPVVEGNDYAARVIVGNPTWATNGKTKTRGFVVKVSNLGAGPFAVTPGDIDAEVLVNGVATGSVAFVKSTEVVPGKRVKFRYKWTYSGVAAGDDVEPATPTTPTTAAATRPPPWPSPRSRSGGRGGGGSPQRLARSFACAAPAATGGRGLGRGHAGDRVGPGNEPLAETEELHRC